MKEYKSKIDAPFYFIAVIIAIFIIITIVLVFDSLTSITEIVILIIAYIAAGIASYFSIIYPMLNTRYVIQDKTLTIKSGFYQKSIRYDEIIEITQKKSSGREPALSRDCIYIKYKDRQQLNLVGISPKNTEDFMNHLRK